MPQLFNVDIPVAYYVRLQVKANNEAEAKDLALESMKTQIAHDAPIEGFNLMDVVDLEHILVVEDRNYPFASSLPISDDTQI